MTNIAVFVRAEWDPEAAVWVATSDDVQGLVVEHSDFKRLSEMVVELVPILLSENGELPEGSGDFDVPVHIAAQALSKAKARVHA